MVRLVFRPYTQVRRTICTSVSMRASTRVSSGFALLRHSSPSFGSQQACSLANTSPKLRVGGWGSALSTFQVTFTSGIWVPKIRMHVGLLGPCFKTGRAEALRQQGCRGEPRVVAHPITAPTTLPRGSCARLSVAGVVADKCRAPSPGPRGFRLRPRQTSRLPLASLPTISSAF